MSLTDIFNSLIWRSRRMTSLCKKNISPSKLYHLSKYSLTIFLRSSAAFFLSKVRNFFFLSGVINPFFFAILLVFCCVDLRCYKYLLRYGSEQRNKFRGQQPHNLNQLDRTRKMDGLFLLACFSCC